MKFPKDLRDVARLGGDNRGIVILHKVAINIIAQCYPGGLPSLCNESLVLWLGAGLLSKLDSIHQC